MTRKAINVEELREFLATCGEGTKMYLGCDSKRFKNKGKWYADFATTVVVHINGKHGCRVFGELTTEPDYDQKISRPFNRMMMEATKVVEMYSRLEDVLLEYDFEIHVDINPNADAGSNVAYQSAIGYIRAMTNVVPIAKPDAFAASYAADKYASMRPSRPSKQSSTS